MSNPSTTSEQVGTAAEGLGEEAQAGQPSDEGKMQFAASPGVPEIIAKLGGTVLVSTYQAGKLLALRSREGRLSILPRTFVKAMGMAVTGDRIWLCTKNSVWDLRSCPELAPLIEPAGAHDGCFVPRTSHITGDMSGHEMAVGVEGGGGAGGAGGAGGVERPWIVNTRFSCLCTLSPDYNFVPRWKPKFITELAAEDRCHLNGLAMRNGKPATMSALGDTNVAQGWRERKASGGVLIDLASGEIVSRGFAMPHSPRWQGKPGAERLWVLNSGNGTLQVVDDRTGTAQTVATFPGYTRGLAFAGEYAMVGLSKIRETSTFGGLPIADRIKELKCGVWFVHLPTGRIEGGVEFGGGITEVFDVQFLPRMRFPSIVGVEKNTIDGIFVAPPEAWKGQTPIGLE